MENIDASFSKFTSANFSSVIIRDGNFANSDLTAVLFDRAYVRSANFTSVNLTNATISNSNMIFLHMGDTTTTGLQVLNSTVSKVKGLTEEQKKQFSQ